MFIKKHLRTQPRSSPGSTDRQKWISRLGLASESKQNRRTSPKRLPKLALRLSVNPAPPRLAKKLFNTVSTENINSKVESFATTAREQHQPLCSFFNSDLQIICGIFHSKLITQNSKLPFSSLFLAKRSPIFPRCFPLSPITYDL